VKPKRLKSTILECVFTVLVILGNVSICHSSLTSTSLARNTVVFQNGQGGNGQGSNGQGGNGQGTQVSEPSAILLLGAVGVLALGGVAYRRFRK